MLNWLPAELILKICSYLESVDLYSCTQVCHVLRSVIRDKQLWIKIFQNDIKRSQFVDRYMCEILSNLGLSFDQYDEENLQENFGEKEFVDAMLKIVAHRSRESLIICSLGCATKKLLPRNSITHHQTILLGPGIDQNRSCSQLFQILNQWFSHSESERFHRHSSTPSKTSSIGKSGSNLAFLLPGTDNVLYVTTIHSRRHQERSQLPHGGNRVWGNELMKSTDGSTGHWWMFEAGVTRLIQRSNSVTYVLNSSLYQQDGGFNWDECRHELCAIKSILTHQQKLLIVLMTDDEQNARVLMPLEILHKLQATETHSRAAKNPFEDVRCPWVINDGGVLNESRLRNILLWLFK